ncbi:MAG: cysteine dioxygenase family protein [Desulfobacterales bacterium]|jgi:predicted metal-dependent enzyme (double-stranded beta helix superfamily)|nr:cysteine dioxygenase family protein [Desulfobacterales bacterium]MCU0585340.1 cysteine dioxygenase family protein [Desulfobacterales bacterium]
MVAVDPREQVQALCRRWAQALKGTAERDRRMEFFRRELPALLSDGALFEGLLKGIVKGDPYPELRQETMFANELVLYRDPGRIFSLRLYIFGPGEFTPLHDHTSWGVSGAAYGQLEAARYRRADDGSDPGHAELILCDRRVLRPGETETTLPFDEGIHRTGNPADGVTLMVSVYGTPLRRLYIQRFNLETGRVRRVFPPRIQKKMLAEQALKAMTGPGPGLAPGG